MTRVGRLIFVALLSFAFGENAGAVPTDDQPSDIIVTGKTDEVLDRFFKAAAPTRHGDQIAHWDERICSKVINIGPSIARLIKDKIDQTAVSIRLSVAKSENCSANIAVIFTDNSDMLTQAVFTQYTRNYLDAEKHFLTEKEIQQAKASRAVRWLSIDGYPNNTENKGIPSRIAYQAHRIIGSSLIIVDVKRIDGLQWGQLAAYVAMVALANPKLGTTFAGQDSILALFDGDPKSAPKDFTAQDRSLIGTLYNSDSYQSASAERSEMRRAEKRAKAKTDVRDNHQ